jgi:hypothetical protein
MEAQLMTQPSSKKEYPIRYVGVVFGNPRSPVCAGYGICRMEDEGFAPLQKKAITHTGCPCYIATIVRIEKQGKINLFFNFLKSELNTEIIKMYFSDTHFRIGYDLLLPTTITHAFDMPPSVLAAGLYPIIEKRTSFQIQIN